ncbi:MAG TPA: L-seryl-tRNA(Sec) selenium transferase [Chloroflexota bacterium]|nr:L-seryl-tRNA(Sec) selenium transferase [Chloroflexota bacterium]
MPASSATRLLPSVDELLKRQPLAEAAAALGHEIALRAARRVLQEERERLLRQAERSEAAVATVQDGNSPFALGMTKEQLAAQAAEMAWQTAAPSLRPVINATGVVIHTNLGRAPLCAEAIAAMQGLGGGYSNLELDLASGKRGDRQDHIQGILREVLGVEAAVVVNNNASAVLLVLTALARGKEVIVSRGQAVEIGGGFRIPDVMRRSGARLVEVGSTNRTYGRDYEEAITEKTAALMRIHSSNFRVIGFTNEVGIEDMAELAHGRGLLLLDDLGSGSLIDTAQFGLMREPMVQTSVAAGVDLVCFSGDKLLGGPQAGIIAGRREAVERCKRDPLMRAMRTDKMTLAALQATLLEYLKGRALETIPVWRMIATPVEELRRRASAWASSLPGSTVVEGRSAIGGGSLPEETLPTALLRLARKGSAQRQLGALRSRGVIARIQEDAVVLDPRTVQPEEEAVLRSALHA